MTAIQSSAQREQETKNYLKKSHPVTLGFLYSKFLKHIIKPETTIFSIETSVKFEITRGGRLQWMGGGEGSYPNTTTILLACYEMTCSCMFCVPSMERVINIEVPKVWGIALFALKRFSVFKSKYTFSKYNNYILFFKNVWSDIYLFHFSLSLSLHFSCKYTKTNDLKQDFKALLFYLKMCKLVKW